MRRLNPLLQRPTYIGLAGASDLQAAASDACDACKEAAASPRGGLVAATLLGVTAAYFAPKVFDWALARFAPDGPPDDADADELDLEVER